MPYVWLQWSSLLGGLAFVFLFCFPPYLFSQLKWLCTRTGCVCQCLLGSGAKAECVSEEKKGTCSRRLFLLPAVSPQEQPASVWVCVIDRHAFSSMRIGSDLKQVLPFLTECLSFLPSTLPCSLKGKGEKGTKHGGCWVKHPGSSKSG